MDNAVLGDEAVTTSKLNDGAVATDKLADGAVTSVKLHPSAAVTSLNKMTGPIELEEGRGIEIEDLGGRIRISTDDRSSIRWKRDVQTLPHAVETVGRLRGVSYEWIESRRRDIGLIAEEVGAVLPEIVEFEANGVDAISVDYARLVAVLIQAINEQQTQITAQEREIDELSSRLERLEHSSKTAEATNSR